MWYLLTISFGIVGNFNWMEHLHNMGIRFENTSSLRENKNISLSKSHFNSTTWSTFCSSPPWLPSHILPLWDSLGWLSLSCKSPPAAWWWHLAVMLPQPFSCRRPPTGQPEQSSWPPQWGRTGWGWGQLVRGGLGSAEWCRREGSHPGPAKDINWLPIHTEKKRFFCIVAWGPLFSTIGLIFALKP